MQYGQLHIYAQYSHAWHLYHFHQFHRHLDISQAITTESWPLHVASSQTQTRTFGFWAQVGILDAHGVGNLILLLCGYVFIIQRLLMISISRKCYNEFENASSEFENTSKSSTVIGWLYWILLKIYMQLQELEKPEKLKRKILFWKKWLW